MQPNKAVLPRLLPNSSALYNGSNMESHLSSAGECSNPIAASADQISSFQSGNLRPTIEKPQALSKNFCINHWHNPQDVKPLRKFPLKPFSHGIHLVPNSNVSLPRSTGEFNTERRQNTPTPDSGPSYQKMKSEFIDHHIAPCSRKRLEFEEAGKSEDSAQNSLEKKRMEKDLDEVEGLKRCNCKKSKCLKLYCECFAATRFCNEACACQGCSNIPEHDQLVSSTRWHIEFRNPLAFAPKVVDAHDYKKESVDNKHITLPSARHRRGCNCKKSKCLKKYCDCYHAGVGCSVACQCKGCMNAHGKKTGGHNTDSSAQEREVLEANSQSSIAEEFNSRFAPPAPLTQGANEKDAATLQFSACFYPSSESYDDSSPSFQSPTSTMNQASHIAQAEENEEPSSVVPYSQQLDYSSAQKPDSLSPLWKELPDICNLSPLPDISQGLCISSASSRTRHPHTNFFKDVKYLLPSDSLHYHSPPSAPHYNLTDEIPEILKDTHSTINSLKAISPNQKRVSTPQQLIHEVSSSYTTGLKHPCKILQFSSHSKSEEKSGK